MNCSFAGKPIASVVIPVCNIIALGKRAVKIPLRSLLIKMGRALWDIYPKKIEDIDILFIFGACGMGGAERVHLDIVSIAKRYRIKVIFTKKSTDQHFLSRYRQITNVIDISTYTQNILARWIGAGYFQKMIENSSVKLVFSSLSGLLYDSLIDIKSCNTAFVELFHAFDGNIEYYSLDSVAKIDKRIVIDSATKIRLKQLYDKYHIQSALKNNIKYISNGVFVPNLAKKKNTSNLLSILFVGRDAYVKRVHLVCQIAKKYEEAKFTLVGIDDRQLSTKNLAIAGKVIDASSFYKEADILLITSSSEGFPMVVMEAMAYGVVPICTNVGGLDMHIKNDYNGFLVDEKNENEIVNEFIKIISIFDFDREKLCTLSKNAYIYAKENFGIEKFNTSYKKLFSYYVEKDKYER